MTKMKLLGAALAAAAMILGTGGVASAAPTTKPGGISAHLIRQHRCVPYSLVGAMPIKGYLVTDVLKPGKGLFYVDYRSFSLDMTVERGGTLRVLFGCRA